MKKITLVSAIIIGIMFTPTKQVKAQNNKGESVVSVGVGSSLLFSLLNYAANGGNVTTSSIPVISATYDYAVSDRFSIGLGVGYQSIKITNAGFTDTGSTLYTATLTISRLNVGIRPIFHFGSNPNIDPYLGFRIGVSIWSFNVSSNDPNYTYSTPFSGAVPSFQALLGLKGYFTPVVGAHIEVAVGTPYYVEAGLSFKFGLSK